MTKIWDRREEDLLWLKVSWGFAHHGRQQEQVVPTLPITVDHEAESVARSWDQPITFK